MYDIPGFKNDSDPSLSSEDLFTHIMERERALPTTLGHGVALPHAKIQGLTHSTCAVALVPEGIKMESEPDPVRLVFMLASPEDEPEMHLAVLGEIAQRMPGTELQWDSKHMTFPNHPEANKFLHYRYRDGWTL